jgi:hypothetical protein
MEVAKIVFEITFISILKLLLSQPLKELSNSKSLRMIAGILLLNIKAKT